MGPFFNWPNERLREFCSISEDDLIGSITKNCLNLLLFTWVTVYYSFILLISLFFVRSLYAFAIITAYLEVMRKSNIAKSVLTDKYYFHQTKVLYLIHCKKYKKIVNLSCPKAIIPITNKKVSIQELNFDWSVYMAAICYINPIWTICLEIIYLDIYRQMGIAKSARHTDNLYIFLMGLRRFL